jgi:murein DD-endopeptidase MepM/ murein hydrolase activator NlpD
MAGRLNTVIFVPHSKAKFVKLSFSTRSLVAGGVVLATALALSVVAIVYTGNAVNRRAELTRLMAENGQLREVNQNLEDTVSEVQARLDEFEERTRRLALAAGMDTANSGSANPGSQESVGSGGPYDRVPESPAALSRQGDWIQDQLRSVEKELASRSVTLSSTPTIAPVRGLLTDGFGTRKDPFTGRWAAHRGVDISARRRTPVLAPADGVVTFAGWEGGFGRVIRVSHGFGFTTIFGHLDKLLAEPGDEVRRGETIGLLGSSGRSTGPHLHYEVHQDGKAVNPLYFILDAF